MSLKQIKEKLSECYKSKKPVLLYGDDSSVRIKLIPEIHINNGGIMDAVEYVYVNEETDSDVFLASIEKEFSNAKVEFIRKQRVIYPSHDEAIDIDNYIPPNEIIARVGFDKTKENLYCKVREAFKSTKKTWVYYNCDRNEGGSLCNNLSAIGDWRHFDNLDDPFIEEPLIVDGRYLYDFKGTLFLDNLKCDGSNNRDVKHYSKFGIELRDKAFSVNWLVAYVGSLDGFPEIFLKQFELIPLDAENEVFVPAPETAKHGETQEMVSTLQDDLLKDTGDKQGDNVFIKEADYWFISYEGKPVQLTIKGNVGLEYIARLLDNPGRVYESHQLRNIVDDTTPIDARESVNYRQSDEGNKEDTYVSSKKGHSSIMDGFDVVLDEEAVNEYKDELKELKEDLEEAAKYNDNGRKDKIREEINIINKQMIADFGLKDRPRRFKEANETARKAISNSVNRVYKKLEKDHEPLCAHLKKNITISRSCSYSSEKIIDWDIKL